MAIIERIDRELDEGLTDRRGKEHYLVLRRERYSRQLLKVSERVNEALRRSDSRRQSIPSTPVEEPISDEEPTEADEDRVVRDRARGLTWHSLSKKHGISVEECRSIWKAGRPRLEARTPEDLLGNLEDYLARLDAAIEDCVVVFETADRDSTRLAAVKTRVDLEEARLYVMKVVGLLPSDMNEWHWQLMMDRLEHKLNALAEGKALPIEILQDIMAALAPQSRVLHPALPAASVQANGSNGAHLRILSCSA